MSTTDVPRILLALEYARAAQEYLRSLPPEHFMEATSQATQRKITLESLDLVHARRPDVQIFNELLVQYRYGRHRKMRQVVPDNMVVVRKEPIQAEGSFDVDLQPVPPFWVLEYVSSSNQRKDYVDSFRKYERELKVPYYLLFHPDREELTLYRHRGRKYVVSKANAQGRYSLLELDLEVGLLDRWVRYWYKGELLLLPGDLQRNLDEAGQRADQEKQRANQEKQRADQEKQRANQEKQRADQEKQRADREKQRANQEKQRADSLQRRLEAAERELDRLQGRGEPPPEDT